MARKKEVSKRVRFEVFKRDSFTCQYCGQKAPESIIHVDHIHPVSKGGGNDIINLVTSCSDCNGGKSNVELSDDSAIAKQQKQLVELNERREQLEMMLEWRNGLNNLKDQMLDRLVEYIERNMVFTAVSESYRNHLRGLLKKYEFEFICDAVDESAVRYIKFKDGYPTRESIENYLTKIKGIAYFKSLPPIQQKIGWIKAIAGKVFNTQSWKIGGLLDAYVEALKSVGWSEDQILNDLHNEVRRLVNESYSAGQFLNAIESWTLDIKKW